MRCKMKRLIIMLAAVGFVLMAGAFVLTAVIAPTLAQTAIELESQPTSAFDMVMESRQTPIVQTSDTRWPVALAFLFVIGIVAVGAIFFMRGGSEMLRQWRLTFKNKRSRSASGAIPGMSQLSEAEWNLIQNARRAQNVPKLEANYETDNPTN